MCRQNQTEFSLEAVCRFLNYQGVIFVRTTPDVTFPDSPMGHQTVPQSSTLSIS